ncbi:MAG: AAA family ATPase [Pyrinomonadaceae bacterium]
MTLSGVVSRLTKVKKTGDGFIASCPAHGDEKPSLSIAEGSDGKLLLNCHKGCPTTAIVKAIGLEMKDLFTDNNSPIARFNGNGSHKGMLQQGLAAKNVSQGIYTPSFSAETQALPQIVENRRIVAVYEYADADGVTLYENVRYEPKDFRQRRPDGNGGYIWNLHGVTRVPYRLPELVEAIRNGTDEIWLTEGEKDADNLRLLGSAATNFKNWARTLNRYIEGVHACLFADHDKAGIKQARDAAKIISEVAESVKVIDLFDDEPQPDKHGKDVSDWIDARRGEGLDDIAIAERLAVIVEGSETWTTKTATADFDSLFNLRLANEWLMDAKTRPIPKTLFDEFWFEGELCILFADTGKGKSILAVQMGESIASGRGIKAFTQTGSAQKVLYFDFELSDKQFEGRYSEKTPTSDYHINHFTFSQNFFRAEIDPMAVVPQGYKTFEEYLITSIEHHLTDTDARVLILDNITYLRSDTERAKDALPLMKELNRLKAKYGLSILVLAHTPKRDLSRPITVNDLSGSKMLSNFADSIFAIGESRKDNNIRYLKQIKTRSTETNYHGENVCVCQVEKPHNFLRLQFLGFGSEREHLAEITDRDKDEQIQRVHDLNSQGKSQREIANELSISAMTVNRYLKKTGVTGVTDVTA